jgi:hypothetical protein
MGPFEFNVDELLKDELVLDKIDVATRQLNAAIRMFFYEWDPVPLHTVVAAAHNVLRDMAKHQGITRSVKDSPLIAPEARTEFLRAVNYPQNFFKHADKDPKGRMAFRYHGNQLFILDSLVLYVALGGDLSREMRVFLVWFQLRYPNLLSYEPAETDLKTIRDSTTNAHAFLILGRVLLSENQAQQSAPADGPASRARG